MTPVALPEPVCAVYDNPATMLREAWQDGRVVAHISATLMATKGFNGHPNMHFALNCGREFEPGKIRGNAAAIRNQP